jgi:hypothetical protein
VEQVPQRNHPETTNRSGGPACVETSAGRQDSFCGQKYILLPAIAGYPTCRLLPKYVKDCLHDFILDSDYHIPDAWYFFVDHSLDFGSDIDLLLRRRQTGFSSIFIEKIRIRLL